MENVCLKVQLEKEELAKKLAEITLEMGKLKEKVHNVDRNVAIQCWNDCGLTFPEIIHTKLLYMCKLSL